MDKKRPGKPDSEDLKGFEEFVEGEPKGSFLPRPVAGNKKDTSFENFTFITTDTERLVRLKRLLNEKLPFAAKFEQGSGLLKEQREEIQLLQKKLFEVSDQNGSAYRRSIKDVFNSYFDPPKFN